MISQNPSVNAVFSLGVAVLFLSAFFGMPHLGMNMQKDGSMGDCPFVMGAVCTMSLFEHLALWQSMAGALPSEKILLFPLLLACLYFVAQMREIWKNQSPLRADRPKIQTRFIARDSLQYAFSSGILHPKLFL